MTTACLVYDGDCAMCTATAMFARRRLPAEVAVLPWQDLDLTALGLTPDDVADAAWWVDRSGEKRRGHLAVGRALVAFGGPWRVLGGLCLHAPTRWLAAAVYRWIASNRHRLLGGTPACRFDDEPVVGLPPDR